MPVLLISLLLMACGKCPECPKAECPDAATTLEKWEGDILEPYLKDMREGVRVYGDEGFGICQGKKDCEQFLGLTAENLPPGDYFIKGEFQVPSVGQSWQIKFKVDCQMTDDKGNSTSQNHERPYDVKYAGKDRGYRIQPLWRIQSPHPNGARACTFALTPVRPDGTEGTPIPGKYSTASTAQATP